MHSKIFHVNFIKLQGHLGEKGKHISNRSALHLMLVFAYQVDVGEDWRLMHSFPFHR